MTIYNCFFASKKLSPSVIASLSEAIFKWSGDIIVGMRHCSSSHLFLNKFYILILFF